MKRLRTALLAALVATLGSTLAGCGALSGPPTAYRTDLRPGDAVCDATNARTEAGCAHVTPELSTSPDYALHFVEFDDQGWLFPARDAEGYRPEMGDAYRQIDDAIGDLRKKLGDGDVLLLVYVHGWKHSAFVGDSDVQKFREVLSDTAAGEAAARAAAPGTPNGRAPRQVIGIYVGWRGNTFPRSEPWSNLTFWTRKSAALRVAAGSPRELFARIRAARNDWHPERKRGGTLTEPRMRSIVIGHSFGAQIAFASLSPSILADLALPVDSDSVTRTDDWLSGRLRQTADLTILVNPAFEASQYEPLDRLAQRLQLLSYQPRVLVIVTSEADWATGNFFPIGRWLGTLNERPFVSEFESDAVVKVPGFIDTLTTHRLTLETTAPSLPACAGWKPSPPEGTGESAEARLARSRANLAAEFGRHLEWMAAASTWKSIPEQWNWDLCGGLRLVRKPGKHPDIVWNVTTTKSVVAGHSEITGDYFAAFLRQLYLDVAYPPPVVQAEPATRSIAPRTTGR